MDRDEQFHENLICVYKRSRRNTNVPEDLIKSMQHANLSLKKENMRAALRMTRKQKESINNYSLHLESMRKAGVSFSAVKQALKSQMRGLSQQTNLNFEEAQKGKKRRHTVEKIGQFSKTFIEKAEAKRKKMVKLQTMHPMKIAILDENVKM